MKPFFRALRYVWPYRYLVGLAWLCAVLVAVLYFFNVGSALPLFQVMFGDRGGVSLTTRTIDGREEQHVVVPPEFEVETGPDVRQFKVDEQARTVYIPAEGYTWDRGGLQRLVKQSEGKFYYDTVKWAVGLLPPGRVGQLSVLMAAIVVLTGMRCVLRFFNGWLVGFVACRSVLNVQQAAFDKVICLPLGYFHRGGAAEASSRLINDALALREGVQSILGKVVMEPLMALSSLTLAIIFAVAIDWRILMLALVAGPIVAVVIRFFARRMRRITRKGLETAAGILGMLSESLSGLTVVKAYGMEGRERRRFFRGARRYLRFAVKAFKTQAATSPTLEFLGSVAVGLAVVIGAYILSGRAGENPGLVINFFIALVAAMDPLRKLANVNNRIQTAVSGSARLFELIDAEPESRTGTEGLEIPRLARELAFQDVHFRYDAGGEEVLRGVSLRVRSGETIAIVGRTGCGKTTLANLIPRFYSPTSGRILIDGVDVQAGTLRSLRDQIGLVSQDIVLFSDTVAANIAYGSRPAVRAKGRPGQVTREEVVTAARMAHADEFIDRLPQGYDTELGTSGKTLSGGQRQRIALARAIIRDPALLILDEATSALDEQTQSLVQDTLEKFVRGRTVIVIAHRLSTIALAQRIVVMDAGCIVDIGTHAELMARCDLYRMLRETGLSGT